MNTSVIDHTEVTSFTVADLKVRTEELQTSTVASFKEAKGRVLDYAEKLTASGRVGSANYASSLVEQAGELDRTVEKTVVFCEDAKAFLAAQPADGELTGEQVHEFVISAIDRAGICGNGRDYVLGELGLGKRVEFRDMVMGKRFALKP